MAECLQRQRNGLLLQVSHNEDSKIHVNQRKPVPACTVRSPYRDPVIGSGVVEGGGGCHHQCPMKAVYGRMFTSVWVQAYRCLSMY